MKIPKKFKLFGHEIKVILDDSLQRETDNWGLCKYRRKEILLEKNIANDFIETTFLHELIHMILDYMQEKELSENEKFVNMFSELLHQSFETMEY